MQPAPAGCFDGMTRRYYKAFNISCLPGGVLYYFFVNTCNEDTIVKIRHFLLALPVAAMVLFAGTASAAEYAHRTFDKLNTREKDALSEVTHAYYMSVSSKVATITGADKSTPARIMATYPERIKVIRQQSRIKLLNVEKLLYSMNLNPEFITNYVTTLRDDVVYFALDQVLRQTGEQKGGSGSNDTPRNGK